MRALLIALLALPAAAAAEPTVTTRALPASCVDGDVVLLGSAKLGEKQLLHGDTGQDTQMVLSVNPDTGKWTVFIVMNAPPAVCVIATGEGMTPGAIEPLGEPS